MQGKAWKFGDNVNTDLIIPARYLSTTDEAELAKHCMEDADGEFARKVSRGDFIVAGENFGCGSSREHAPVALKACGVAAVIAGSFARIFFRNAINIGLAIIENKDAAREIQEGDKLEVSLEEGYVENLTRGTRYAVQAFSKELADIVSAGGLMNFVKQQIEGAEDS